MDTNHIFTKSNQVIREHKVTLVSLSAVLVGNYMLFAYLQKKGVIDSICMFKNVFGIPCPGCGMTRSCLSLMQFNFQDAFYYHPFSFLLAGGTVFFLLNELSQLLYKKRISYHWLHAYAWIWFTVLLVLLMLNWFWSIHKGI